MLQTYEATLEPNGQVWFSDFSKPIVQKSQKIIVTIVSPLIESALSAKAKSANDVVQANPSKPDWSAFSGVLKNTTAFAGDPLSVQQQLRSEWR